MAQLVHAAACGEVFQSLQMTGFRKIETLVSVSQKAFIGCTMHLVNEMTGEAIEGLYAKTDMCKKKVFRHV